MSPVKTSFVNLVNSISLISIILFTLLIIFLFIHMNYKKYTLFSTANEIFMFRKMLFNKKLANCAGKKTIISHLVFCCYLFSQGTFVSVYYELGIYRGDVAGSLIFEIILTIIFTFIIRLIYEFIVIPVAVNNKQKQLYQQNVYTQQANQQPTNTPYTQQNNTMPQNHTATYTQPQQPIPSPYRNGLDNTMPIQAGQQLNQEPMATEAQSKFCSQCGTKYNAAETQCPNCGMQ